MDEGTHNKLYCFEKLDNVANFSNWKFYMEMSLKLEDLWACVLGTEIDAAKNTKAYARICLSVKSHCLQYVRNATTPQEAWDNLKNAFENKGLYRRVTLLRQLHQVNYSKCNSMSAYIDAIMSIVQQLADIDKVIEDSEAAEILLFGLPPSYDALVSSLESSVITTELVRTRLLQEEHRRLSSSEVTSDAALAVKKLVKCHYCEKVGHVKAKCYKLKRDKKKAVFSESAELSLMVTTFKKDSKDWIVDSGATSHMCRNVSCFSEYTGHRSIETVAVANGETLDCLGRGSVRIHTLNGIVTLNDVMHIPGLSTNLISVSKLCEKALSLKFSSNKCLILRNNVVVLSATRVYGVYRLDMGVEVGTNCFQQEVHSSAEVVSTDVWHKRLGHLCYKGMCTLQNYVSGFMLQPHHDATLNSCVSCVEGKQHVVKFPRGEATRATQVLELVHSDVCGPLPVCSFGGAKYLLTLTDDFSRKSFGFFMKSKSEMIARGVALLVLLIAVMASAAASQRLQRLTTGTFEGKRLCQCLSLSANVPYVAHG